MISQDIQILNYVRQWAAEAHRCNEAINFDAENQAHDAISVLDIFVQAAINGIDLDSCLPETTSRGNIGLEGRVTHFFTQCRDMLKAQHNRKDIKITSIKDDLGFYVRLVHKDYVKDFRQIVAEKLKVELPSPYERCHSL